MIRRVLTSSFHSIVSRFFVTATNLFVIYFISKNLGNTELGNYGIVFFFFIFFSSSSFNQHFLFSKEIAKHKNGSDGESILLNEFITVSLTGIILAIFFPILISLFYKKISFTLLALSAAGGYLLGVERNLGGILLGKEKMPIESFANFVLFSIVTAPMVLHSRIFDSIEKIIILRIIALLIVVLIKIYFMRVNFRGSKITLKLRFFKEGKYYWFTGLSSIIMKEVDVLILSFFIDKSLLGAYFLALRIYFAFGILSEVIAYGLTPFISRTYNGKESRGFKEFNKKVMVVIFFMAALSSVVLFFGREFFVSLFSPDLIQQSGRYLFFFSFLVFFRFFSFFTGIILTSTEFQKIRFYIVSVSSLTMVTLDVILAPFYQIGGVIASRTIVELAMFLVLLYFVRKVFKNYTIF
ncbi:MAG: MATE family efflux transporter [Acidobacteriota bacterium]